MNNTFFSRACGQISGHALSIGWRLLLIVALAIVVHVAVKLIRLITEVLVSRSHAQKSRLGFVTQQPKFITLIRLIGNGVTFLAYFFAMGFFLEEFGVNLTAYLASASIVGLAISFGSQGLVQDMVIGLTLIFSDAMDVGDMVEITGTTAVIGRVEEIGLRFTKLVNFYDQTVFVPNRTIANVSRFPRGGIDACAHIQIPAGADKAKAVQAITGVAQGMRWQFGTIILSEPAVGQIETESQVGWEFLCVTFKVWPGQGSLIETTFRQQMVSALKAFHPNYADWQVSVTYGPSPSSARSLGACRALPAGS
jgi:small conductance mechanosensitive channel